MKLLQSVCVCLATLVAVTHAMTTAYPGPTTRLAGGTSYAGRVEVWHNGEWGTVCDDEFGDVDASVVCYSLGYGYVGTALPNAAYGPGTGRIWLDSVACTGTETFVGDCNHQGWGMHNCVHGEDVSVDCGGSAATGVPTTPRPIEPTATQEIPTAAEPPQTTAPAGIPLTTNADAELGTTGTTSTVAPGSTTTVAYPTLPAPFTELSHEAEMVALDMSMTPSCLNQYSDQFKLTLTGELEIAKQAILSSPDFCPGAHDVTLKQTSVNMMAMNVNVYLNFDVDVITQGTETLDAIEYCSYQLGNYLADFNNWKQPIWIDIYNCPRLQFTSGQFNLTSVAWKCP